MRKLLTVVPHTRTLALVGLLTALVQASACGGSSSPSTTNPAAAISGNAVKVTPLAFDPAISSQNPKIESECGLQAKLPEFIAHYANGQAVVAAAGENSGRVLTLTVTNMWGLGGGIYSGLKRLEVVGELSENGQRIAGFTAQRSTSGGMYGGYKGTCSLMGRCVKVLGRDIATWLANPVDHARLGEQ